MNEPVVWTGDGSPYSPRFGDRYRPRAGGLAQAATVFLAGCGLPQRWREQRAFTVLEAGFGLGLNFLATWAAWEADARRCDRLHFVSIEAHPVAAGDIVRNALSPDLGTGAAPQLLERVQVLVQQLARGWRGPGAGIHRLRFAGGRVELTLAVGEVRPMLQRLDCGADAVYLDGFSPARNPDMWSIETLRDLARHCRPGTTLASYSVAHQVRDALQQLGFRVDKRAGLPPKRHRLEAVFLSGEPAPAGMRARATGQGTPAMPATRGPQAPSARLQAIAYHSHDSTCPVPGSNGESHVQSCDGRCQ